MLSVSRATPHLTSLDDADTITPMLHIIAGHARGMRLQTPRGSRTRPTSGRVRTSLFSILGGVVHDAAVVDLFAGSGALGLEALSRGAASCCFVESARLALKALEENIGRLHVEEETNILRCDAFQSLPQLAEAGPFDLILLDPPYPLLRRDMSGFLAFIEELAGPTLLAPDGIIVVQHGADTPLPDTVGPLEATDRRDYGDTAVTFLEHPA